MISGIAEWKPSWPNTKWKIATVRPSVAAYERTTVASRRAAPRSALRSRISVAKHDEAGPGWDDHAWCPGLCAMRGRRGARRIRPRPGRGGVPEGKPPGRKSDLFPFGREPPG